MWRWWPKVINVECTRFFGVERCLTRYSRRRESARSRRSSSVASQIDSTISRNGSPQTASTARVVIGGGRSVVGMRELLAPPFQLDALAGWASADVARVATGRCRRGVARWRWLTGAPGRGLLAYYRGNPSCARRGVIVR